MTQPPNPNEASNRFTNQKPRVATHADVFEYRWGCRPPGEGLRCKLCGHKIQVGDTWRWVCCTSHGVMNLITCEKCDGTDVVERWKAHVEDSKQRFWWLYER